MSVFNSDKECNAFSFTGINEVIGLILDVVKSSLGMGLTNVLLYSFGRSIGEDLFNLHPCLKSGGASLEEANEYLVNCLKIHNLVKDTFILKAFRPDGRLELVCRINSKEFEKFSKEDSDFKTSLVYFFYRGILSRYYELFFKMPLEIKKVSTCLDENENTICEFVLITPLEERVDEP